MQVKSDRYVYIVFFLCARKCSTYSESFSLATKTCGERCRDILLLQEKIDEKYENGVGRSALLASFHLKKKK